MSKYRVVQCAESAFEVEELVGFIWKRWRSVHRFDVITIPLFSSLEEAKLYIDYLTYKPHVVYNEGETPND